MGQRIRTLKHKIKKLIRARRKKQLFQSRLLWETMKIKQRFAKNHPRKLALLIGPESTGTRIFTEILSSHPDILGTPDASAHGDVLDDVWECLENDDLVGAMQVFPVMDGKKYVLTRRSVPHATGDHYAYFMDFPAVDRLYQLCEELNLELVVLLTSRSTAANLASWALQRASASKTLGKAKAQYLAAYRHLFKFLIHTDVPFFFLSLEALVLDQDAYVQSVFELLGLEPYATSLDIRPSPNRKRYEWFSSQPDRSLLD